MSKPPQKTSEYFTAESILNFETKNKVLTHFFARFRRETQIRGGNFGILCMQLFRAGLRVNLKCGHEPSYESGLFHCYTALAASTGSSLASEREIYASEKRTELSQTTQTTVVSLMSSHTVYQTTPVLYENTPYTILVMAVSTSLPSWQGQAEWLMVCSNTSTNISKKAR